MFKKKESIKLEFYRRVFWLTLPIIIQNLIVSLLNMMDTVMIGKLGEVQLASVGIANQYFFMFTLILFGVNAGGAIFVSQFWGKKDIESIKTTTTITLVLSILVSLLFTALAISIPEQIIGIFNNRADVLEYGSKYLSWVSISYLFTGISLAFAFTLRSIENTLAPMLASVVALMTNIMFNYVLIFGKFGFPKLGVQGAAIATDLARIAETIIIVVYVYLRSDVVNIKIRDFKKVTLHFWGMLVKGMAPVVLNEMVWGIGNVAYNMVYAHMGVAATASTQITSTIMNLFMIVIMGLGSSSMIVVGKELGAGKKEQGIDYARRMYRLAIGVGVFIGIILLVFADVLVSGFRMSEEVLHASAVILRIYGVIIALRTYNFIMVVGILRGGGDSNFAVKVQGSTMWLFGIPLSCLGAFVLGWPIYLVVGICTFEELIKGFFMIRRFKSGKWIHNITRHQNEVIG